MSYHTRDAAPHDTTVEDDTLHSLTSHHLTSHTSSHKQSNSSTDTASGAADDMNRSGSNDDIQSQSGDVNLDYLELNSQSDGYMPLHQHRGLGISGLRDLDRDSVVTAGEANHR